MRRTFEYRLYPTRKQAAVFDRALWSCRKLYNAMLWQRQLAYHGGTKRSLSLRTQRAQLTDLRTSDPEYGALHTHILQDVAIRLDRSFKAFFRRCKAGEKPGYPRFKGRDRYNSLTYFEASNGSVRIKGGRVSFSKLAENVRVMLHRPIRGTLKTATLRRKASGWYVLFSCDDVPPDPALAAGAGEVGIDVGLTHFATLSDGSTIANPRYQRAAEAALTAAQRRLSRKLRGSNRRRKARAILAGHHEKVHSQRKDFHFKTARALVQRFGFIAVEDLDINDMVQSDGQRSLHRSIADASWGNFLRTLEHKAEEAGATVVRVEPRGTTQDCSGCGAVVHKTLRERVHRCACGLVLDRDLNAARNILQRARHPREGHAGHIPQLSQLARTEPSWRERSVAPVEARSPCL